MVNLNYKINIYLINSKWLKSNKQHKNLRMKMQKLNLKK